MTGAIATLAFVAVIRAQQPGGAPPPRVDAEVLKNAGTPADSLPGSWLSYGHSQSETRYSPLKQIDTSNASRLGLAWSYVARRRRRQSGRNAAGLEQHALRHHDLERRLRARRPHRQGTLAMGSGSEPAGGASADLLRHRQPRPCPLQRHDLRARHRRTPDRARRAHRQAGLGGARRLPAGLVHHHHGAAHREWQGDRRRFRRRQAHARILRRL